MNESDFGEMRSDVKYIREMLEKQNGRLGKVEDKVASLMRWRAWVLGMFTTAGTTVGAILGKFSGSWN